MCIKNTHFKCLKSYYRDSRVEVTHLFLEWRDWIRIWNIAGSNSNSITSKITGVVRKENDEIITQSLVSIQINNVHVFTGVIFREKAILTTAACAEQIIKYVYQTDENDDYSVQICYEGILDEIFICDSVKEVFSPTEYIRSEKLNIYNQINLGLIRVSLTSRKVYTLLCRNK